jgi:DNA polymerase-1
MKLKNTYVDALPVLIQAASGRLHTSFNQTGTETGRLSSTNPNLQNIPIKTDAGKQIRKAFVAFDKKSVLLSCDYSQIELRILAHLSQDGILTEAFRQGRDIHKATAALIYGVAEADMSDPMRDVAKRVNFGIIYGLTSYGLSRDLGISPAQAQGFIDAYFLRYPGVRVFLDEQIKKAESDGFVVTLLGRRRYIPEINNKSLSLRQFAQRQAVNAPIQGSASDLIKYAMIEIYAELSQNKFRAKMIMQVHDELVFNVPEDELRVLAVMVKAKMEQVIKLDVPIGVDMKQGRNWSEMEPLG